MLIDLTINFTSTKNTSLNLNFNVMQETKLHALLALSFVNQSLFLPIELINENNANNGFLSYKFQNFTLQFLKLVETLKL